MFYKVVYNNMIIDAIADPVWVIWLSRSGRFLATDPVTANGVVKRDGSCVYNLSDKPIFENYQDPFKTVSVVEITQDEYDALMAQITPETGSGVENQEPDEIEVLRNKIIELEQYAMNVSLKSDGLAEQLEATKILLGVE